MKKNSKSSPLRTFILGLITLYEGDEISGYELGKIARDWHFENYIKASQASFYYHLKQLDKEGFFESTSIKDSNRPERMVYKFTSKGRDETINQLTSQLEFIQNYYFDIDSVIPFLLMLNKRKILKSIKRQIEGREDKLKFLKEVTVPRIKSAPFTDLNPFSLLIAEHHKLHYQAEIKFLEKFYEMVDGVDFAKNIAEIIKRRSSMEKSGNQDRKNRNA